ncbi:MAG: MFS transporter [Planctomycetaceae bacterium]|nr:MFS transporter [Planctomycetaceae bacterium]
MNQVPEPQETQTHPQGQHVPWYKLLSRYHWFVFIVCSLGWGFDCFDQQLFNLMRMPALAHLMHSTPTDPNVAAMGGYATSVMLIGWAIGGIFFGVLGDRIGRAKVMILTILVYATFTGFSGLALHWWDFLLYRFLTGLGVGGQFAAGVTLLAESMPDKARAKSLGMLQIVAAACNVGAGVLVLCVGLFAGSEVFGIPTWRLLFFVGFLPALLAIVIFKHLQEPEKWKKAMAEGGVKKAGSIKELFGPKWRYNIILGMLLSTCGVIGLWGIGFFSVDLTRMTFMGTKNKAVRDAGRVETEDFEFVRMLAASPEFLKIAEDAKLTPRSFIDVHPKTNDPGAIYAAVMENKENTSSLNAATILAALDRDSADGNRKAQTPEAKERRQKILDGVDDLSVDEAKFRELAGTISARARDINSYVSFWAAVTGILFNIGAVLGTFVITIVAERLGRRPAFTIFFLASLFMTLIVFLTMSTPLHVLIMTPMLGFCILSIFGGYAIYFPELFPTHLRSTAVSFCYNIGRFIAATGPFGLGLLTAYVFHWAEEPLRYAGAAMSVTFILGIIFTWMGPETKGKPLPE